MLSMRSLCDAELAGVCHDGGVDELGLFGALEVFQYAFHFGRGVEADIFSMFGAFAPGSLAAATPTLFFFSVCFHNLNLFCNFVP